MTGECVRAPTSRAANQRFQHPAQRSFRGLRGGHHIGELHEILADALGQVHVAGRAVFLPIKDAALVHRRRHSK